MRAGTAGIREGFLNGLPYLKFGDGPPLFAFTGLSGEHANPKGIARLLEIRTLRPLRQHFAVYLVNRKPDLPSGTTVEDLADHYAGAIKSESSGPVPIIGSSTGGSIAQQFAIDHPGSVERLVLADTACRLGPLGRQAQRDLADLIKAGQPRRAWAALGPSLASTRFGGRFLTAMLWVMAPAMDPNDPSDLIATIEAEDNFDACKMLHRIKAPTVLVAGERDGFYSPELFKQTADAIPNCRLRLYPGKGHGILNHKPARDAVVAFLTEE